MNSRQLQYAVLLSEIRNFSQVAEQLDISQPALSKQIISLEQELGVKLFNRSTTPLSLTPAGEFFVKKAESILFEEDQLVKTMDRYKSTENGKLIIGISPFRSLYLMPRLIKELNQKYPDLQVVLSEFGSSILHKGIAEGLYDFAIMNLPVDESRFNAIPLEKDELVLAVPNPMLSLIGGSSDSNRKDIDLLDCTRLPFIAVSPGQEMRQLFEKLCTMAGLYPRIQLEVVGITTAWTMVQAGIGATILPRQFIYNSDCTGVTLFDLKQKTLTRQPAIITQRGQYISPYAEYAIKVLTDLYR